MRLRIRARTCPSSRGCARARYRPGGRAATDPDRTDYFVEGDPPPYTSALVDNRPPAAEMLALSKAGWRSMEFSRPVDELFFAVLSLNGNGYEFNRNFEIVSSGCGYWGCGGLEKVDLGN
jgi:hypothetical protein